MQPFEIDMETIRRRARDHMMKGPLTPAYGSREHDGPHSTEADRQRIVAVLQETLFRLYRSPEALLALTGTQLKRD